MQENLYIAAHRKQLEAAEQRAQNLRAAEQDLHTQYTRALLFKLDLLIDCPAFDKSQQTLLEIIPEQMASDSRILPRLLALLRAAALSHDGRLCAMADELVESLAHDHAVTHGEDHAAR